MCCNFASTFNKSQIDKSLANFLRELYLMYMYLGLGTKILSETVILF